MKDEVIGRVNEFESIFKMNDNINLATTDQEIYELGFECRGHIADKIQGIDNCDDHKLSPMYEDLIAEIGIEDMCKYIRLWVWEGKEGITIVTHDDGNGYCTCIGMLGEVVKELSSLI